MGNVTTSKPIRVPLVKPRAQCQEGNPALSAVVPTITWTGPGCQTDGMSPVADPPAGGGQPSPDWQQVQTLGVAEIAMTILEARKTMPTATAAAVCRERHGGGFRVRISLLEDEPQAAGGNPHDRDSAARVVVIFVARQLGKDLADAFGEKDVIILK